MKKPEKSEYRDILAWLGDDNDPEIDRRNHFYVLATACGLPGPLGEIRM